MDQRNPDRGADALTDEASARYATLGDYVRVIRRHRVLIALATLLVTALAIGYSVTREPTYDAVAQVSFRDPLADTDFLPGFDAGQPQAPQVRAAASAELVYRPSVTGRVASRLDTDVAREDLIDAISTTIGAQTQLVNVEARWSDADFAARLANAYADQVAQLTRRTERRRLGRIADAIQAELDETLESDNPSALRAASLDSYLSQVNTVRQVADPAEIVSRAQPPTDQSSPNTTRNGVIGGVLGLMLGLVLAFVRDSLDRRLYTPHDVHEELGAPVLGRISKSAFGHSGLVRNGGSRMPENEFEPFRVLRMNLAALQEQERIRSVLVTSGLPEEGKSTVSLSLASAAAATGQRVLLVECDLRRPCFARRLGVNRTPGLTDYLMARAAPHEILQVAELSEPLRVNGGASSPAPDGSVSAGNLVCITAGSEVSQPAELLMGPRFDEFIEKVTRAYDMVVLDSSPMLSVVDPLELVPRVDCVLVCTRVHSTTRDQLRATRAALGHVADRPTGAVVTGIRRRDDDAYEYYYGY